MRYSWDNDVRPDFKIVVRTSGVDLTSKQGLNDYTRTTYGADMTALVNDIMNMRIRLTKTDTDLTKFKLFTHSFIEIDVI